MLLKDIIMEDFVNYKKPSMFILFPDCSFKCEKECGIHCCQNSDLVKTPNIDISIEKIINMYNNDSITKSIVMGGLEPFDSWNDLYELIVNLRFETDDDIVIYTGYYKYEIEDKIEKLKGFNNIIIKFGRFIPNLPHHIDSVLGVELSSNNQYAELISNKGE